LIIPTDAPWLTASRTGNSGLTGTTVDTVTFTVNRTGLPGGNYQTAVSVTSNAGSRDILVTLSVPPLIVSEDSIDFGSLLQTASRFVNISNPSGTAAGTQITAAVQGGAPAWLSVANPVTTVDPQTTETIRIDANPAGLDPGIYTGTVTVRAANLNFTHMIAVRMEVPGLSVNPSSIDFGEITERQQQSFTLENLTGSDLSYQISVPASAPWVILSSTSGTLAGSTTIQLTADPDRIQAGSHEAVLSITFGDGGVSPTQTLTVRMSRPEPAGLEASPKTINFGTALLERRVALWNVGIGTVNWTINTTGFPAWLSLQVVPGSGTLSGGIATGTVSGDETDEVILRVNRALAPAGQFELAHSFTAVASGDANNVLTISLSASIARVPVFVLEADGVDGRGISTLAISETLNSKTFVVRNEGTGPLNWAFGQLPPWIASLEPAQGTLQPNVQQTVTVTISRAGLRTPGVQAFLEITTNDPANETVFLDISVAVPPVIRIGTLPANNLGFAAGESLRLFSIFNDGDPETRLNYQVVTNQEWLSVAPANGVSIGTASALKDFRQHSVTIDRSRLDGAGSSARIIISAFRTENGVSVPDPTIPTVEVPITVEAASLTIESALPRTRVPSQVRNLLMLRNIRSESIPIPRSRLQQVGDLFRISEMDVPLELSETNQFLKSTYSANVLILLDFSGSMLASAQQAVADGQLGDPDALTEDAIKSVYAQGIMSMIDEMPAHFRVGLAVFNDRPTPDAGAIRLLNDPNDGEGVFTRDRNALIARFSQLTVQDHGASEVLPAVRAGARRLQREDTNRNYRPFDDVDLRALVVVTDGRDTTLERATETANLLQTMNVRLFMIGWGAKVEANSLIQLSTLTGGHYYSTRARNTGVLDPFGVPVRIPLVSEFVDWCTLDPADECDQSVPNDLGSQVLFSYTTLSDQGGVLVTADLSFNDPNDQDSECLPDQGEISARTSYPQQDFASISGDARLAQIALHTNGIANGRAVVTARADYMPRNITELEFEIIVESLEDPVFTVGLIPQVANGLIPNWTQTEMGNRFRFTSPNGEPIRFADFGDLFQIVVEPVTQAFDIRFEVTTPTYNASNFETKYVTHPTGITVGGGEFLATSFPAPFFDSRPAPLNIDGEFIISVGADTDQVEIDVFNLGGSHVRPGATPSPITGEFSRNDPINVGLDWMAAVGPGSNFLSFQDGTQEDGFVTAYDDPSTMFVNLNRALTPPGFQEGSINFTYGFGGVQGTGTLDPILIRYTVENPEFDIDVFNETTMLFEDLPGLFINFEATPDTADIRVSNVGQSTLQWSVDPASLPPWVGLSSVAGSAGPDEGNIVTITIIRINLPEGNQFADIVFTANYTDPITLTISAEGLPRDAK